MTNVNPPPQLRMPKKLYNDKELRAYFERKEKILFQIWNKLGGTNDFIQNNEIVSTQFFTLTQDEIDNRLSVLENSINLEGDANITDEINKRILNLENLVNQNVDIVSNDELFALISNINAVNEFQLLDYGTSPDNGVISAITTITTTSVTLDGTYFTVLVDDDTAGGAVTVNLPPVAQHIGRRYRIKKLGTTANVTADGNGSETIDGATTAALTAQYETIEIQADANGWWII